MSRDRFDRKDGRKVDPKAYEVRRIEVITGVGGRRRWPSELKERIVRESLEEGVVITDVARRHGLRPQQLFDWRRKYRETLPARQPAEAIPFAPVVLDKPEQPVMQAPPASSAGTGIPEFEIVTGSFAIRLRGAIDGKALATVLRAVKAAS